MSVTGSPPDSWQKTRRRLQRRDARQRLRTLARHPAVVVIVVVLLLGAAGGITAALRSQASSSHCQKAFIPAYFPADVWAQVAGTKPVPSAMILNPSTGIGAGTAPNPAYQGAAKQAQESGSAVLGYSSTADGQRPISQVEADVRNYKAWYGVTGIFLDSVNGVPSELSYYEQLTSYIHKIIPGATIWLNPGIYPDQQYMSLGNVMMVFEGTYAQYQASQVPSWARSFPASRFANTIYGASSSAQANSAVSLSRSRNTGYVYVTNLAGANPYDALPSYWSTVNHAITTGCRAQ
jgi:Spherulation-specific family 4